MNFPFLVEIFFGISLVVFCIAMYVILPAFIYKKRTVFKPKLINAMWNKFFAEPRFKLGTRWTDKKKIEGRYGLEVDEPVRNDRRNKRSKNKTGLY